jgi:hypothetical protein
LEELLKGGADVGNSFAKVVLCASDGGETNFLHNCPAIGFLSSYTEEKSHAF